MVEYNKECFVIGAIGEEDSPERIHADWLLEEVIEPVFGLNWPEFRVVRADRISTPGLIDAQVIDRLLNDRVVIADLTFLNPNAFYELGIRHVMQKPVIHVHRAEQKIPFDVSLFRSLKFSVAQPKHIRAAREELTKLLKAVLSDQYQVENPVTKARGRVEFEQTASSTDRVLQGEVESLSRRLKSLEDAVAPTRREAIPTTPTTQRGATQSHALRFFVEDASGLDDLVAFRRAYLDGLVGEGFALDLSKPLSIDFTYPTVSLPVELRNDLMQAAKSSGVSVKRFAVI